LLFAHRISESCQADAAIVRFSSASLLLAGDIVQQNAIDWIPDHGQSSSLCAEMRPLTMHRDRDVRTVVTKDQHRIRDWNSGRGSRAKIRKNRQARAVDIMELYIIK
jgi:hypothetical protein